MGYLVVRDPMDLGMLADSVLRARLSRSVRASAIEAIRAANPGLDLDRLTAGAVVVIPPVDGIKVAAAKDGPGSDLDDLLARVQGALGSLADAAAASAEAAAVEQRETRALLGSAAVKRLAGEVPGLRDNLASVAGWTAEDTKTAKRRAEETRVVVDGWLTELAELRALGPD